MALVRLNHDQRKELELLVKRIGWSWPNAAEKFHLSFGSLIAVRRGEKDFDLDAFDWLRRVARAVEGVAPMGSPDRTFESVMADIYIESMSLPASACTARQDTISEIAERMGAELTVADLIKAKTTAAMMEQPEL